MAGFPRSLCSLGMTRKNRIVVRCTCDNSHRFLSRRCFDCVSLRSTWHVVAGCKIAVLCKNRRCGNCNAHKCALPRATLGFCTSTAQRICTISSSTDKNSCHNFVKLSAWWLAFARCFQPHTRRKPHTSNYTAVHSDTLYARTHTYIRTHMRFVIYMNYKSTMHKCQHQN